MTIKFKSVLYNFSGDPAQDELPVNEKDILAVLDEDNDWILVVQVDKLIDNLQILSLTGTMDEKLENMRSIGGVIPSNYVEDYQGQVAHAIHEYDPQESDELPLIQNEQLLVIPTSDDHWSLAMKNGKIGIVPKTYVELGPFAVSKSPSFAPEPMDDNDIFMTVMDTAPMNIRYFTAVHVPSSSSSRKQGTLGAIGVSNSAVLFVNLKVLTIYKQFPISSVVVNKSDKKILQIQDMFFKLDAVKDVDDFIATVNDAKSGKSVERDLVKETMQPAIKNSSSNEINKSNIKVLHDTVQKTATGAPQLNKTSSSVAPILPSQSKSSAPPAPPKYAKVLFNFVAKEKDEISVNQNQCVLLFGSPQDDWIEAELLDANLNSTNKRGYVPFNYCQIESKETLAAKTDAPTPLKIPMRTPEQQPPVKLPEITKQPEVAKQQPPLKLPDRSPVKQQQDPVPVVKPQEQQQAPPSLPKREPIKQQSPIAISPEAPPLPSRQNVKPQMPPRQMPPKANNQQSSSTPQDDSAPAVPLPNSDNLRTWKDKSGGFSVRAEFLGLFDDKVHLFKTNGVKIGVPLNKLCQDDKNWITSHLNKDAPQNDNNLAPTVFQGFDWFQFFKSLQMEDPTAKAYAIIFVKERLDMDLLKELSKSDLRELGIAQGDVLRILKKVDEPKPVLHQDVQIESIDQYFKDKLAMTKSPTAQEPNKQPQTMREQRQPQVDKINNNFNSLRSNTNPSSTSNDILLTTTRESPKPTIIERRKEIPKSFDQPPKRQQQPPPQPQRQQERQQSISSSVLPTDSISQQHSPQYQNQQNQQNQQQMPIYQAQQQTPMQQQQPLYYNPALANMQRQQQLQQQSIRGQTPLVAQPMQQRPTMQQMQMGYQIGQQMRPLINNNQQFVQQYQQNQPGPQAFPQGFQQGFQPSNFNTNVAPSDPFGRMQGNQPTYGGAQDKYAALQQQQQQQQQNNVFENRFNQRR